MATLIKVPAVFAFFILCSLLVGCDLNSDVGVDQESAPTLEVSVQASAPESKVVADAVSEVSLVKSVVPLAHLVAAAHARGLGAASGLEPRRARSLFADAELRVRRAARRARQQLGARAPGS